MNNFKRGDILRGTKKGREEAYHPIVFIDGPEFAPSAVILTHKADHSCNSKLNGTYDGKPQYVVAHLIEKLAEWGPYQKDGRLTDEDIKIVDGLILGQSRITWQEYLDYQRDGCPDHRSGRVV